jgi:hypothetical protein
MGADSVVGFVLIVGISLLTITVVTLTGGPLLSQFQSQQQAGAMQGSFTQLDQAVSTLVSGAPEGATPSWRVSMGQGSLSLDDGAPHIWGFAADTNLSGNQYRFFYADFSDPNDDLKIQADGSNDIDNSMGRVNATKWDGSTDLKTTTVVDGVNIDSTSTPLSIPWDLEEHTTQIEVFDKDESSKTPVAEAWFVPAGAVQWVSGASERRIELFYQNTGIIAETSNGQVFHNSPLLNGPQKTGNGEKVFVRVVNLDGAFALGGRSNAEILVSGEGNHPRYSNSEVNRVQLYPPTRLIDAWERRLTDDVLGFTYTWTQDPAGEMADEGVATYNNGGINKLSTTFVQTDANMSHRGGT